MRKAMILCLIIVLSFHYSGCDVITVDKGYELRQETSEIESVILCRSGENNTLEGLPLMSLSKELFEQFVADLMALPFKNNLFSVPATDEPSFSFGEYVITISYTDDSMELISNGGYQEYVAADDNITGVHYTIDDESWQAFLEKYFSIVLPKK